MPCQRFSKTGQGLLHPLYCPCRLWARIIQYFLRVDSRIHLLSQSWGKNWVKEILGLGRVYTSVCVLPFPPPCTVTYRFNTVLIGIWLSLLHPVVSPDNATREAGDTFQVLKTWACLRADWEDGWLSCCWWQSKLVMGTPVALTACQARRGRRGELRNAAGRTPFSCKPGQSIAFLAVLFCFALGCGCPTKGLAFATAWLEGWGADTVNPVWSSFLTKRFGQRD